MTESAANLKERLTLRKRLKRKKPSFRRQESWRYKRLKENWRKPKGLDNKMRRKIKGWPRTVEVGYRGPKNTRGLHPSGYKELLVHNTRELHVADPNLHVIRIAHTVGKKKRAQILVEAREKSLTVLNPKEPKPTKTQGETQEENKERADVKEVEISKDQTNDLRGEKENV